MSDPDPHQTPQFTSPTYRLASLDQDFIVGPSMRGVRFLLEFAKADAPTWISRCEASGVPCGPINDFGQAMADPHFLAREMVTEVDHPILGRMKMLGIPTKFKNLP